MKVSAVLGILAAAPIVLGSVTAPTRATSELSISSAHAVRWCVAATRGYAADVTIVNRGSASGPQRFDVPMVFVRDSSTPTNWSGSSGLPAIRPNRSTKLTITLTPRSGKAAVTPTLPLVITLDRAQRSLATWPFGAVVCRSPKAFGHQAGSAPAPAVAVATVVHINVPPPVIIPQPKDLTYTTNPKTCAQHAGLVAAILCPDIINRGGTILLVWRWDAKAPVDGFDIYRTTTPNYKFEIPANLGKPVVVAKRILVDTQTDASLTIRAIKPFKKGECFIVTAYRGKLQSDPSNRFCVGETAFVNTPMGVKHLDDCHSVTKGASPRYSRCQYYNGTSPNYHYALTWDWSPCAAPGCISDIDGYIVYVFYKGAPNIEYVAFAQKDPALRAADGGPWKRGTCYEVTAFKGLTQSQASNRSCVSAPKPTPAPTPKPTPRPPPRGSQWPSHVDVHITGDYYPNIDVVQGGSVTWYNDDNEEHTVNWSPADDPIIEPGSSYTLSVGGTGGTPSGWIIYQCDFHPVMIGRITIHCPWC